MNCLVALGTKTPDFPCPLWENGFQLENIEPRVLLSSGSQAKPDIQFKKHDDYIVFFECKDGHCDKEQLERYKQMTINDVRRSSITSLSAPTLSFDLAYFGTAQNEKKLVTSISKDGNTFPILILYPNSIKLVPSSSKFTKEQTNAIFGEVKFDVPVPQSFIPFTVDDDDTIIKIALLQYIISKFGQAFTMDLMLSELFPHVINHYSREGKADLKGRIGRLLSEIKKMPAFSEFIEINTSGIKIKDKGLIKFRNACAGFIEQLKEEQERTRNGLMKYMAEDPPDQTPQ